MVLDPSIEATLQDFVRGNSDAIAEDFEHSVLWRMFNAQYHIEDWPISTRDFIAFIEDVKWRRRCSKCGTKEFPYFMQGDKECLRCLT